MKAVFTERNGLGANLVYGDMPRPEPKPREVLIEVVCASVNPIDWKIFKVLRHLSFKRNVLGKDVAGKVFAIGGQVKDFSVGDEVYSFLSSTLGGGYAEYAVSDESTVALKPGNMDFCEAAAVPLAATTAWQALELGNISGGNNVLVIGASGGVGTYGVQIAKALGTRVTGVCSTPNMELVASLGADRVIDYKKEDFRKVLSDFDIVFDSVGKHSLGACKGVLKRGGTYITTMPTVRSFLEIVKTKVSGVSNGRGQKAYMVSANASGALLNDLRKLIEEGKMRSVIDSHFLLENVVDAHVRSKSGRARGKIVIDVKN